MAEDDVTASSPASFDPFTSLVQPTDPNQDTDPTRDPTRTQRTWLLALGAIAVVTVVALAVWLVLSGRHRAEDLAHASPSPTRAVLTTEGTASASPTPVPTPTAPASPTATPSPTPTPDHPFPAPAGAVEMSDFSSPSGNISCFLGAEETACTIAVHAFTPVGDQCDATPDAPFTVHLRADGTVTSECASGFVPSGAHLGYGSAAHNGDFACVSSQSGVDCWSQVTGTGIMLSRQDASVTSR